MKPKDLLDNVARFWARVDQSGDCWVWTGEKNRFGYGRFDFWHDGGRSRLLAHRLVLLLTGRALADGDVVMHACDNPPCVNPAHLSIGTQADNLHDALSKGRMDLSGLEIGRMAHADRDRARRARKEAS